MVQLLLSQCGHWSAQYFHCEARAPKRSAVKNKTALQIGFDFVKEEGPRTTVKQSGQRWRFIGKVVLSLPGAQAL